MSREYAILSRRVFIATPAMPSGCLCLAHDDLACRLILGGPVPSFPFVKLVAFVRSQLYSHRELPDLWFCRGSVRSPRLNGRLCFGSVRSAPIAVRIANSHFVAAASFTSEARTFGGTMYW
jgi:hypothetical protein